MSLTQESKVTRNKLSQEPEEKRNAFYEIIEIIVRFLRNLHLFLSLPRMFVLGRTIDCDHKDLHKTNAFLRKDNWISSVYKV